MERQFLESFGLEKNQIDSILNEHSKDIGAKIKEINELQTKLQGFETTVNEYEEKLNSANSTITTLKNSNKDNEALQQKITDYQNQIKSMQESFENERKNTAIISALRERNFIDPDLVKHLIDSDKVIKAKDGSYSGLAEQIESIVSNEKYQYLINQTETTETVETPTTVDRGGYDPTTGFVETTTATPNEKKMIGEVVGLEKEQRIQQQTQSAENFWNSFNQ